MFGIGCDDREPFLQGGGRDQQVLIVERDPLFFEYREEDPGPVGDRAGDIEKREAVQEGRIVLSMGIRRAGQELKAVDDRDIGYAPGRKLKQEILENLPCAPLQGVDEDIGIEEKTHDSFLMIRRPLLRMVRTQASGSMSR